MNPLEVALVGEALTGEALKKNIPQSAGDPGDLNTLLNSVAEGGL